MNSKALIVFPLLLLLLLLLLLPVPFTYYNHHKHHHEYRADLLHFLVLESNLNEGPDQQLV